LAKSYLNKSKKIRHRRDERELGEGLNAPRGVDLKNFLAP